MPHAVLIDGAPGWGQAHVAARLAYRLLPSLASAAAAATPDAARGLAHPDLRWIDPDGAVIKVDAVRAAIEFAASTADEGSKVIVLNDAHCLNTNAANALLKTLEEPNPGTFVLLASGYASRLLPTVRSRVQRFSIAADTDSAANWLAAQGYAEAERLLFEVGSAPLLALPGEQAAAALVGPQLETLLGARGSGVPNELLELPTVDLLLRWLRYVAAELAGEGRIDALNGSSRRNLLAFSREIVELQQQVLASNSVNVRLQLERLIALWQRLPRRAA